MTLRLTVCNYLDRDDEIGILGDGGEIIVVVSKHHDRRVLEWLVRAASAHPELFDVQESPQ